MPYLLKPFSRIYIFKTKLCSYSLGAHSLLLFAIMLLGMLSHPGRLVGQTKKIVLLAGPKDHGVPGRHEYEKDLRLLAQSLDNSPNLKDVEKSVYVGKAPRDPNTDYHGYDEETTAFLQGLDSLMKENKMGVVVFHYANWVENWTGTAYRKPFWPGDGPGCTCQDYQRSWA
jgi:hypothetical protein